MGASEGLRVEFWSLFWRVLGPLFVLSDGRFVPSVKKCLLRLFLGAKIKGLLLQNQGNRTVHPSKIEGALPMAYVFQKMFLKDTYCSAKAYFGGFKLY